MLIISRITKILFSPTSEWQVIDRETDGARAIVLKYLLPLAVVPAIGLYLRLFALAGAYGLRYGIGYSLLFIVEMAGTVLLNAFIVDKLAPTFDSEVNYQRSVRLVVYSATPVCLGSLLIIVPFLEWIGPIIGLIYSIYLIYKGLPIVKRTPLVKVGGYTLAIVVSVVVVWFLLQTVMARIFYFTII